MVRITAENLDERIFVDAEGNVLDPAFNPYVLMPDPKERETDGPCQLWVAERHNSDFVISNRTRHRSPAGTSRPSSQW